MISVGEAVQLILLLTDFFLDLLDAIHHIPESSYFCGQQLVADLHQGLVDFMTEAVVAANMEQLLVGVIRHRTMVVVRSCVDVTLVHDSPLVHTSPHRGIHAHVQSDPLGWGDAMSIDCGNVEWDVVESAVADKAFWSGG
jgi:hypothetical protein